jgi:hypothetical protein
MGMRCLSHDPTTSLRNEGEYSNHQPCGLERGGGVRTFDITHRDANTQARRGRLLTPHGVVDTPVFAPVGTQGAVKTLFSEDLEKLNTQLILGNTYHL